jgi:cytochrome c oxidase cbb3-type subunit IV
MDLYTLMREFADSWALLVLVLFFVAVAFWAYRPGSRPIHDDAANLPFRNEKRPAQGGQNGARALEALK